jgi:phage-related holin
MNDVATMLYDFVMWLWTLNGFRVLLGAICVSVGSAVAAAVYDPDDAFSFKKFFEFLWKKVVPFGLLYGVAKAASIADPTWAWLNEAAWGILMLNLGISVADNLRRLGVPVPDDVAGRALKALRSSR